MDFAKPNIKLDNLTKNIDTKKLAHTFNNVRTKLKNRPLLLPAAKLILLTGLVVAIVPMIPKIRIVRAPLAGTKIGGLLFCQAENLCGDARCIGETWRECKPCPTGKSRAAFKVSCDKTFYSECVLKGNTCSD